MFPTNKGLANGIPFRREVIPVRLPKIPRPPIKKGRFSVTKENTFDKRRGYAYKEGRYFTINNAMRKILKVDI